MSMFKRQTLTCPACAEVFEVDVVDSVNADRRPDLRAKILDGSFQVQECPSCGATFRIDPLFNYLDIGRGQWISVQPVSGIGDWTLHEEEANVTFRKAYGDAAPPAAREIGEGLRPRLVFGWAALREKLLAADEAIDDLDLECAKLAVIRGFGGAPIRTGVEFRMLQAEGDTLFVTWIEAESEATVDALTAPRSLIGSIGAAPETWNPIKAQLSQGPFVDVQRLWIGNAA